MNDQPLFLLCLAAGSLYVGKLWLDDVHAARAGIPLPRPLPGATWPRPAAVGIAVLGALLLLAAETAGEIRLGLAAEQSTITWLFGFYSLTAAILEETIFRGFLVVENRGRRVLWLAALGASVLFALLHPHLWRWDAAGFALSFTAKGAFSTAVLFATSLWLYVARFAGWNPTHSLLPCIAAHAAKNVGVIAIKYSQGFVGGAW